MLAAATLLICQLGELKLESGQVLRNVQIGYRTFGQMNAAKSNVVLFPSWFNGTSEDLVKFIGPGPSNLVDSSKFFVVAVDALSNGVSTSPSNSDASQKGSKFPRISIADMVESQRRLLRKEFGIETFQAVVGVSMGGMQAFQWTVSYPEAFQQAIPIVGTPRMGEKDILLWSTFLKKIKIGGGGGADSEPKRSALSGFLDLFRSPPGGAGLNDRDQIQDAFDLGAAGPAGMPRQQLDIAAAASFAKKNPFDVLRQFEALIRHDISRPLQRDWDRTAGKVRAQGLVIVASTDKAVSPATPLDFASRKNWQTLQLHGPCGHKAYDCERESIGPVIDAFLSGKLAAR